MVWDGCRRFGLVGVRYIAPSSLLVLGLLSAWKVWELEEPVLMNEQNKQDRSFIEQQMAFYGDTKCFGTDREVLKRGVEIVEYMNDLIDSFD
jgi:hypothetical protein